MLKYIYYIPQMEGIDPQDKDKLSEVSSDSFDRISDTSSVKSFRELND